MSAAYTPYRYDPALVAAVEQHLDQNRTTRIASAYEIKHGPMAGAVIVAAEGFYPATHTVHPRLMIQLLEDGAGSAWTGDFKDSCPGCDNWAYTARCADHPEKGAEHVLSPQRRRPGGLMNPPS